MNDDIHSLSGAYALDAVDDLERSRFEAHMRNCAECRDEVDSLREVGAMMGSAQATGPSPAVRTNVLREIRAIRPMPPIVAPVVAHVEPQHRSHASPLRWLTSAAAAVLLVAGGLVWHPWQHSSPPPPVDAISRVVRAPDAQTVVRKIHGGTAKVIRSASLGRAVIAVTDIPAAPAGKVYELWLFDSRGNARKAGLLPPGDQTQVNLVLNGDASTASAAGITVEPAGGSEQPTSPPIATFSFA